MTASETTNTSEQKSIHNFADKDGQFRRQVSSFRSWVSPDPNAEFPAEKDRYVRLLYFLCVADLIFVVLGIIYKLRVPVGTSHQPGTISERLRGYNPARSHGLYTDRGGLVRILRFPIA